jgi:hypothetical protein
MPDKNNYEKIKEENIKITIMTEFYLQFDNFTSDYIKTISDLLEYDIPGVIQIKMRNMQQAKKFLKKESYVDEIIIKCKERIQELEKQQSSYFDYVNPKKILGLFFN